MRSTPAEVGAIREIRHWHLFAGLGGGAQGFNEAQPRAGGLIGKMRCIGAVDVDKYALMDMASRLGVTGTLLDLFSRDQYQDYHGHPPPTDWREATISDLHASAGHERPHIVFLSAPCQGLSGLLPEALSRTRKYQALNELTVRGIWMTLEAWKEDPPETFIFENVPRIATRGRHLLDQIVALLEDYGYAVAETTHDCGEIGGLAESRKRFLLIARHLEKVPPFIYEPDVRPLRGVGTVLGRMPLPGDLAAGPMHRVPRLQWQTWCRLAFVEAGSDWRSLNRLSVSDGYLTDYAIATTDSGHAYEIQDPRFAQSRKWNDGQAYGVHRWGDPTGTITGQQSPGQGAFAVADPRASNEGFGKYAVVPWAKPAGTVIAGSTTGQGAFAVADPRIKKGGVDDVYLTAGHYGVVAWSEPTGAISASACHDNGKWSVADPRAGGPAKADRLVAVIRALDDTWHRPFTTLELAAIQSLVEPEDYLELSGLSDQAWRARIGNAVPPAAARAIAEVIGTTLLLAWSGETFMLSAQPIWVRPIAMAMAVAVPERRRDTGR